MIRPPNGYPTKLPKPPPPPTIPPIPVTPEESPETEEVKEERFVVTLEIAPLAIPVKFVIDVALAKESAPVEKIVEERDVIDSIEVAKLPVTEPRTELANPSMFVSDDVMLVISVRAESKLLATKSERLVKLAIC